MTFPTGSRLGPYEILALLGAGGMGEVYKARDTRLERTVAIKVLPSHLSSSPEVRQRFEREAKTISQLSHPHICALHDVGREGETDYLVMELLEGETLTERLSRGALPLEQTLRYGAEIADALDKAHRQGIVHRDLKPGNVMLTKSGVKLLDFGLAKAFEPPAAKGALTSLPTRAALTQEGTILGTFQYMAPEQLEGKEADARTDIFAFGAVLYEMATGRKAFSGSSQASLISAIMQNDPPPISTVQPMSPAALDRVVKACLAKDPEERWQSAADVKRELQWISEGSAAGIPAPATRRRGSRAALWVLVGLLAGAGITALFLQRRGRPPAERLDLSILPPPGIQMADFAEISPDGRSVAFVGIAGTARALYVRSLASPEAKILPGTEGAAFPFWSPDSRSLAFFTLTELRTVDLTGARSQVLCPVFGGRGGAWSPRGVILFSPYGGGLQQIAPSGGAPSAATELRPGERSHRFPAFLPDGRRFLVFVYGPEAGIYAGALGSKELRLLLASDRKGLYASPGFLLFHRGGSLLARSIDPGSLQFRGDPVAIAEDVWGHKDAYGASSMSVSDSGALAYREGAFDDEVSWVDRSGRTISVFGFRGYLGAVALSPDGKRLAGCVGGFSNFNGNLSVLDLDRGTTTNIATEPGIGCVGPRWSRDGSEIFYRSTKGATTELRRKRVSTGKEEIVTAPTGGFAGWSDVTPDGRYGLMGNVDPKTRADLFLVALSGDRTPQPLLASAYAETEGQFSPDGKYIAYSSDETGRFEIYLRRFPLTDEKWIVSQAGGDVPRWRADGRELFFLAPGSVLMSAPVTLGSAPQIGQLQRLFELAERVPGGHPGHWSVAPDGQRFLIVTRRDKSTATSATVILNWADGLHR